MRKHYYNTNTIEVLTNFKTKKCNNIFIEQDGIIMNIPNWTENSRGLDFVLSAIGICGYFFEDIT